MQAGIVNCHPHTDIFFLFFNRLWYFTLTLTQYFLQFKNPSNKDIRENFNTKEYLNTIIKKIDTSKCPNIFVQKNWYTQMSKWIFVTNYRSPICSYINISLSHSATDMSIVQLSIHEYGSQKIPLLVSLHLQTSILFITTNPKWGYTILNRDWNKATL